MDFLEIFYFSLDSTVFSSIYINLYHNQPGMYLMSIINTSQCLVFLGVELFVLKNIDISQDKILIQESSRKV